uniref:Uncharacterized protein n=1 Tax=Panagrolaimus superbus TaxID=310955 RepID=A0A914XYB3_9BILA
MTSKSHHHSINVFATVIAFIGFLGSICWLITARWILKLEDGYLIHPILSILGYLYLLIAIRTDNLQKYGNAMGFLILNVLYGIAAVWIVPYVPDLWKPTTENYWGLIIVALTAVYAFMTILVALVAIKSLEEQSDIAMKAAVKYFEENPHLLEEDDEDSKTSTTASA